MKAVLTLLFAFFSFTFAFNCFDCVAQPGMGWCPVLAACIPGNASGPLNQSCPSSGDLGSWAYDADTCNCLYSTDCTTCIQKGNGKCGWCPNSARCYRGDASGIIKDLTCNTDNTLGSWTYDIDTCSCLQADNCAACIANSKGKCGFCPSTNKCYQGSTAGPVSGLYCTSDPSLGQWTIDPDTCSCLRSAGCSDCVTNSNFKCGWCPRTSRCYQGNNQGPSGGLTCTVDPILGGGWANSIEQCSCITARSCSDCITNSKGLCGWCPSLERCFQGTSSGPSSGIVCQDDESLGQWSFDLVTCNCLNANPDCSTCITKSNYKCGWCEDNSRCYQGSSSGPSGNITCTTGWDFGSCPTLKGIMIN
eukprot:TRINITY_DN1903_c0_g1_i1.p1 TRINITY_DN1903_c0_g1~~TRINITY_DN1903_c0_g1_i1.p1  ORF type:complete len:362 (+),score=40.89 TRINITY_DN1903_c0_g1_i1:31-1116(+)